MVAIAGKRAYKAEWERGKRRSETFEERELRLAKRRKNYASRATDETRAEAKERSAQWRKIPGNRGRNRASHAAWYDENREYAVALANLHQRLRRFNMTEGDYNALLQKQNSKCAICGSEDPGRKTSSRFAIDHSHRSGRVRGLLCHPCNVALGSFRDDPERMRNAILYIEQSEPSI